MRRMQLGTWMGSDVFSQRPSPHCPSRTSALPGILGHQGSLLTPRKLSVPWRCCQVPSHAHPHPGLGSCAPVCPCQHTRGQLSLLMGNVHGFHVMALIVLGLRCHNHPILQMRRLRELGGDMVTKWQRGSPSVPVVCLQSPPAHSRQNRKGVGDGQPRGGGETRGPCCPRARTWRPQPFLPSACLSLLLCLFGYEGPGKVTESSLSIILRTLERLGVQSSC